MHLEILYKSVSFVSQIKITEGLFEFKARKEKMLLEQQIRNNEQKIKRKQSRMNKKEDEFDQDIEMKNENHMNSKKIKENQEIKYTNKQFSNNKIIKKVLRSSNYIKKEQDNK